MENFEIIGVDVAKGDDTSAKQLIKNELAKCYIDWDQIRYEIAKELLPAVYTASQNRPGMKNERIIDETLELTDLLLNKLK